MTKEPTAEQMWHDLLNGKFDWDKDRKRFQIFPAKHRCKNCNAPFDGVGAWYARLVGRARFNRNPRFCNF